VFFGSELIVAEVYMGIGIGGAKLLLAEAARRPFQGRILTLGRQDVYVTAGNLDQIASEAGAILDLTHPVEHSSSANSLHISDRCLFKRMGFSDVTSMDVSNYEDATQIFDLNSPDLPESLIGRFDVIYDGGTMEHVFHVPNVMNNIFRMLSVNGRIIHHSPSSNHIDHGFYMFSPTFFWDFYATNRFEVNCVQMIRYLPDINLSPWEISDYTPGCLSQVSGGGLDDAMYLIHAIFTKTPASTGNQIPQQGYYLAIYAKMQAEKLAVVQKVYEQKNTEDSPALEATPRPLAIQVAKMIVPFSVRRMLRTFMHRVTQPAPKPVVNRKGLQLPVKKCRTKYD
jgi:hypothetical protein